MKDQQTPAGDYLTFDEHRVKIIKGTPTRFTSDPFPILTPISVVNSKDVTIVITTESYGKFSKNDVAPTMTPTVIINDQEIVNVHKSETPKAQRVKALWTPSMRMPSFRLENSVYFDSRVDRKDRLRQRDILIFFTVVILCVVLIVTILPLVFE